MNWCETERTNLVAATQLAYRVGQHQIAWQLADAGTSIAANYEEAKGSDSRREFAAKNAIVLCSQSFWF